MNKKDQIIIDKEDIRKGLLKEFNQLRKSSFQIMLCMWAHEKDRVVEISIEKIRELTGFSQEVIIECQRELIKAEFVFRLKKRHGGPGKYLLKCLERLENGEPKA